MSIKALVVFRDGSTRTVEVAVPAPRDIQVQQRIDETAFCWVVNVFRPLGSDNAPIYEEVG